MTKIFPLVSHLETLQKNRGALAKLRRGLGSTYGDVEMYPYVVSFLPKEKYLHGFYFLVASLFGMHSETGAGDNESIGAVFSKFSQNDSVEKRFKALINADEKDLSYHLRQAVSLARSKNIPVNYHRLLQDLLNWSHPDHFVQLQWARDFWGSQ
jgi:CRISPR system Cascade subunit CasB